MCQQFTYVLSRWVFNDARTVSFVQAGLLERVPSASANAGFGSTPSNGSDNLANCAKNDSRLCNSETNFGKSRNRQITAFGSVGGYTPVCGTYMGPLGWLQVRRAPRDHPSDTALVTVGRLRIYEKKPARAENRTGTYFRVWAEEELNLRPLAYQASALTT